MPRKKQAVVEAVDLTGSVENDAQNGQKEASSKDPSYSIELAKTGRATCKKCDTLILNRLLRVGVMVEGDWGLYTSWQHLECTVFHKSLLKVDDIDGYSQLKFADQQLVLVRFDQSMHEVDEDMKDIDPDKLVRATWNEKMDPSPDLLMPLLPYQKEGLGWMYHQEQSDMHGGILADEMGMGKTIQAISLMLANRPDVENPVIMQQWQESDLHHDFKGTVKERGGTLIILPTVAIRQWQMELSRFTRDGSMTVKVYHGSDRSTSLEDLMNVDVVITSYKVLEIEYRKATAGVKIACSICGKKFYPEKLRVHRQYFCGESAQRTEAQSKTQKKKARVVAAVPSVTVLGPTDAAEEIEEDEIDRQKKLIKSVALQVAETAKQQTALSSASKKSATKKSGKTADKKQAESTPASANKSSSSKANAKRILLPSSSSESDNDSEDESESGKRKETVRKLTASKASAASKTHAIDASSSESEDDKITRQRAPANNKKASTSTPAAITGKKRVVESSCKANGNSKQPAKKLKKEVTEVVDLISDSDTDSLVEAFIAKKSVPRVKMEAPPSAAKRQSLYFDTSEEEEVADTSLIVKKTKNDSTAAASCSNKKAKVAAAAPIRPKRAAAKTASTKMAISDDDEEEVSGSDFSAASSVDDDEDDDDNDNDDDDIPAPAATVTSSSKRKSTAKATPSKVTPVSKQAAVSSSKASSSSANKSKGKKVVVESDIDDDSSSSNDDNEKKPAGKEAKSKSTISKSRPHLDPNEELENEIAEAILAHNKAMKKASVPKSPLHDISWFRIILDEAHMIKDRSTSTAKAVFNLVSLNKWCLSGTPLQNRVGELYSLIRFLRIDPHAYYFCRSKGCSCKSLHYRFTLGRCNDCNHSSISHFCHFNRHILNPIQRSGYVNEGRKAMLRLKEQILDDILLRRTKANRADDIQLPMRVVTVRQERMDEKEDDFYQALYTQSQAQFNTYLMTGTVLNNYAHIFDILIRLRQAVDHPYLVIYSDSQSNNTAEIVANVAAATAAAVVTPSLEKVGADHDELEEAGLCGICDDAFDDPVRAGCGHCFCRACAENYMTTADEASPASETGKRKGKAGSGAKRCPVCDALLSVSLEDGAMDVSPTGNGKTKGSYIQNQSDGPWSEQKLRRKSILSKIDLRQFQTSTKMEALMEELYHMAEEDVGAKAIVFSQFVNMLDLCEYRIKLGGIGVVKLQGSLTIDQRDKVIRAFKEDPDIRVLLVSLKAGGVALNLTVASRIFLMDPWWNPAAEMQAIDRTHRIGQYKPIFATRFIIENSIEERILQLQEKKKLVFDGTVGGDSGSMSKLTVDDMRFLFQ